MNDPTPAEARCVLLFTRAPRHEVSAKKLRGGERFFAHLLRQTALRAAAVPGVDLLIVSPCRQATPRGARWLRQREGTFAQRLEGAIADARGLGYQQIVAIGCDTPGLETADLTAAFRALADHELVLGPAPDGGVYLIGVRGAAAGLLENISWCTPRVLSQLAASTPSAVVLRAVRGDVDRHADVRSLMIQGRLGRALMRLAAAIAPAGSSPRAHRPYPLRFSSGHLLLLEAPRPPPLRAA